MELYDFIDFKQKVLFPLLKDIKDSDTYNCIKIRKFAINKVFVYYQKKRNLIRGKYMNKDTTSLDRHKVAACFMYAILKAQIIKVNRYKKSIPPELLMANEYLAFYTAINIVNMYKIDILQDENYRLVVPRTYCRNNFTFNTCNGLYLSNPNKNFDVLAYSTILFLLEKYTDKIKNIQHPIDTDEIKN